MPAVRLGSRGSALALAQAELIRAGLEALGEQVEVITIRTSGDERPGGPAGEEHSRNAVAASTAASLADKSRFVKEIEEALLDGRIDLAVHSAKDVPGELPDGLAIVGVPERADARDALCGRACIEDLAQGAAVGTASLRRQAQLLAARPDLEVREVRGNVDTRLRKLAEGGYDALVLAAAGLDRLGIAGGTPIPEAEMTPAPGQGCLALEARAGEEGPAALAQRLTHRDSLVALTAERALVTGLEATCRTPVGAHARLTGEGLRLDAFAGLPDGGSWIRDRLDGDPAHPAELGRLMAERMLAAGARELLDAAERAAPAEV